MKNEEFKKAKIALCGLTEVVVFGAGETGELVYTEIKKCVDIKHFLDSNSCKTRTKHDVEIKSPTPENCKNYKIVIATNNYRTEIRQKLEAFGLEYNVDFFYFNEFMAIWNWVNAQKVVINKIDVMITSRCTLNCRDCVYFIPAYSQPMDRPIDLVKEDIALFFDTVDYIREISIVGGEPFMHENLNEIIEYIAINFKEKTGTLQVITNGTVLPNQLLVKSILDNHVQIVISDYTETLPWVKGKLQKFLTCMQEHNIDYIIPSMGMWVDYGNPTNKKSLGCKELDRHFELCAMPCRVLEYKKYFFCTRNYGAVRAGLYEAKDGYFPLNELMKDKQEKEEFLKFEVGVVEKGYLDYCDNCNGFPTINKKFVPAAVQIEKNTNSTSMNTGK